MTDLPAETIRLTREEAELLSARLSALGQAARVFGSGLAGIEIEVGWTLKGRQEAVRRREDEQGRQHVRLELDLRRVLGLLMTAPSDPRRSYVDAFKAAFLHELGHILFSPGEDHIMAALTGRSGSPAPTDEADSSADLSSLHDPDVRRLLKQVRLTLEDARVERLLIRSFRGAERYLDGHALQARAVAVGDTPPPPSLVPGVKRVPGQPGDDRLARLTAALFLRLWGRPVEEELLPAEVAPVAAALGDEALEAAEAGGEELSRWLIRRFVPAALAFLPPLLGEPGGEPEGNAAMPAPADAPSASLPGEPLHDQEGAGRDQTPGPTPAEEEGSPPDHGFGAPDWDDLAGTGMRLPALTDRSEEDMTRPGWLSLQARQAARAGGAGGKGVESQLILYPHLDGGMVLDDVPLARADQLLPTERTQEVLATFTGTYGPAALDAFAGEAAALRRAFQVNYERRLAGRHRSGKRMGVANLRRFVVADDLRLFQRVAVPDRLSYYFHLLVDVSPSMLANRNLPKALAVGYAFTEALDRLRVPVDVTLYSTAVTVLHDHRRQSLDRYFGGCFSYLSAGTHEVEAIAFAKQQADQVGAERKLIVVVTDGYPNLVAPRRGGSDDLRLYYRQALIPWLAAARIDLIGVGIGTTPDYHPDAVSISTGWDSLGVFLRLLDEVIARGQRSHQQLWR